MPLLLAAKTHPERLLRAAWVDEQKLKGYSWSDRLSVVQPPSPPGGWPRGKSSWKTSLPGPRPGFGAPCLPCVTPGSSHVFTMSETGSTQEAKSLTLGPAVPPLGTWVIASVIRAKEDGSGSRAWWSSCASSTDTRSAQVRKSSYNTALETNHRFHPGLCRRSRDWSCRWRPAGQLELETWHNTVL